MNILVLSDSQSDDHITLNMTYMSLEKKVVVIEKIEWANSDEEEEEEINKCSPCRTENHRNGCR